MAGGTVGGGGEEVGIGQRREFHMWPLPMKLYMYCMNGLSNFAIKINKNCYKQQMHGHTRIVIVRCNIGLLCSITLEKCIVDVQGSTVALGTVPVGGAPSL